MNSYKCITAYEGTRYNGWQKQGNTANTIQGKLEEILSKMLNEPIEIAGSGRTDAGVHAKGQVANFHCESTMPAGEILNQLRRYLPEDIGIYSCREVSPRFHARLNAKEKTYCYRIWNSDKPCVFDRRYVTVIADPLNLDKMRQTAAWFPGEHDFSAFCGNAKIKKSTVRFIRSLDVDRVGEEIRITVTGNGFLHNMVRIIAGTLIEAGRGERQPESVGELFGGKRSEAGFLAPGQGLCLMEVEY